MTEPAQSPPAGHPTRAVLGTPGVLALVLGYAVFGGLWILFSDKAMEGLFHTPYQLTLASTVKGWFYVAVTSLALYLLLRRLGQCGPVVQPGLEAGVLAGINRPSLPFVLLALIIAGVTGLAIQHNFQRQRADQVARLHTIADLKARQITDWLAERRGDAEFLQDSPFFVAEYARLQRTGASEPLRQRLEALAQHHGFSAAQLLSPQGEVLLGSARAPRSLAPPLLAGVDAARAEQRVQRVGPYLDQAGKARLSYVVPLTGVTGPAPLLVLHSDPAAWLYDTLQTWPVPTASGETVLFRRDGDEVTYINTLRFRRNAELKLHLPVSAARVIASRVLRGEAGLGREVDGVDYRGVPVLGVVRAIPGTDWFLIAKMDVEELRAKPTQEAIWIGLAGLLALFIAGAGLLLLRLRNKMAILQGTRAAEAERVRALKLLEAFAESSDDAIFAKDLDGRFILFNRAAGLFVGKPVEDVLGRDDRVLFPPEQAQRLMEIDRRAIRENRILTEEEVLDTPQGTRVFLATKGPLRDERGQIIGTFGISRDITESRWAEDVMADQMRRFHLLLDSSRDGIVIIDQDHRVVESNQRFADMLGYSPEELLQLRTWDFDARLTEAEIRAGFADLGHTRQVFESRHRRRDGSEYDVEVSASGAVWSGQNLVLCICRDITERKHAEAAIRESEARWIMAIDSAGHGVWDWNCATNKVFFSPTWKAMLGYDEAEIGDGLEEWSGRVHPDDLPRCLAEVERHFRGEVASFVCEHRVRCKDGSYKWILDQGRVVVWDSEGKPGRMIGTHTDISPVKAAQEALRVQSVELAERNAELERFNRATVGRELDMIELKRQINTLTRELGREAPYDLSFAENSGTGQTS